MNKIRIVNSDTNNRNNFILFYICCVFRSVSSVYFQEECMENKNKNNLAKRTWLQKKNYVKKNLKSK